MARNASGWVRGQDGLQHNRERPVRAMENIQDKAVQDVAEAGKALPRELRKRFPKT